MRSLLFAILVALVAPVAHAAGGDARAKLQLGETRLQSDDYAGALEAFKEAVAIDPNLAEAWRALGLLYVKTTHCAEANQAFTRYFQLRPEAKAEGSFARELGRCQGAIGAGDVAEQALVTVAVTGAGKPLDGAVVRVDGLIRGAAPLDLQTTPGHHALHVEHAGYQPSDTQLDVAPNETRELTIDLTPNAAAPAVASPVEKPRVQARVAPSRRKLAWAFIGISAAGFALGAAGGILESNNWHDAVSLDHATTPRSALDPYKSRGTTYSALAYSGYALGGAALIVGAVLFIVDSQRGAASDEPRLSQRRQKPRRFVLAPSLGPSGGGLAAVGQW